MWAPTRADGASGATGYRGSIDPVAGFVSPGKGEREEEGGNEARLAYEET